MAMLKEEQKALRDHIERTYGIRLREDDEMLPVLHFIHEEANKVLAVHDEIKKQVEQANSLSEEMKIAAQKIFMESSEKFKELYIQAGKNFQIVQEKTRSDLSSIPQLVADLKKAVAAVPVIPSEIKTIQERRFETGTQKFLWGYFMISVLIIAISIASAFYYREETQRVIKETKAEKVEWLTRFYIQMRIEAPNATQKFIEKNPEIK